MKLMATLVLLFSLFQTASAQAPFTMTTGVPTNVSASEVQFDVIITPVNLVNAYKFQSAVIRGNLSPQATLTSSGTVSWGIVPGSAPATWPVNIAPWPQNVATNFAYNITSGAISFSSSATYFSSANAPALPNGSGTVLCRLFVKVTGGTFTPNAPLGFAWNVTSTGAGLTAYVGAATTATNFQNNTTGCTKSSPNTAGWLLNPPTNICPTSIAASNVVDPLCFGGTGSADFTLDPVPTTIGGNYTVDGGASVAYTTNPFSVTSLSQGTHTIVATNTGCSPVTTTVTIGGPSSVPTTTQNETQCDSYTWPENSVNYTTSGTYTAATTIGGCPGVATLNLTINTGSNPVENETQCDSYTWAQNGTNYTTSGTYTAATNVNGCPGVATLNLTINTGSNPVTNASDCSSYTWAENGLTYFAAGTYTAATNVNGCPGVATLNLTLTGGHMVLATANNAASTVGSATATGILTNNAVTFQVGCDYAAMINDGPSGVGAGATTVTVDVAAANYIGGFGTNGQVYAPRKFTVSAANNEAAGITLYATQDDFDDYNSNAGSLFPMTSATVKIAQVVGGFAGTITPIATVAIWNPAASRYEISGEASELNGEYYLYTDPQCALSMGAISVASQTQNSTTLTWAAVPGALSYDIRFRVQGQPWTLTTSTTTSKVINTGLYNTVYEVQGKVRCSSTTSGLWNPTVTTFTTAASPCQPAANLAATLITPNSVTMTWASVANAQTYVLQYRVVNTQTPNTWQGIGGNTATSRLIIGLANSTLYECRIATSCVGGALSPWSTPVQFTTLANPCAIPSNIAAVATATTANVTWDVAANATTYVLRYSTSPTGPWSNAGCITNSRSLGGLTANTTYYVQVQSICGGTSTSSAWSANYSFTTGVSLRPTTEPASLTEVSAAFNVYPNPTTDVINVELTAYQAQTTTVKVYDLTGRLMKQVVSQTEAGSQKIEVSLGEIASGVYTVQVYENDKMTHISRVRKN